MLKGAFVVYIRENLHRTYKASEIYFKALKRLGRMNVHGPLIN